MNEKSIQKGLEQDAQVIKERIHEMAKLNARQKADSLRRFMKERHYSQAYIAKMIDVSPAVISQFLAGKYKGDLKNLVNKIVNLINSVTRREKRIRTKLFIETTVAKQIGTLIKQTDKFSDEEGKIGLVVGDGGHGKSVCLKQYAEANKNTIYVELDAAMTSKSLFAEIAKKLNIDSSGSLDSIARRLIENLQNREIIIMIDEASALTIKQLNQLRTVLVVKARCPLILAGNRHLLKTIMQPTTRRGFESLDQFTSRLMYILDLDSEASDKSSGLYTAEDIRKLYEFGGIRLTSDAVSTLRRICMSPRSGRLRTCSHIISALLTAGVIVKASQIEAKDILSVIEQLRLPVRVWLPLATKEEIEEQEIKVAAKAG